MDTQRGATGHPCAGTRPGRSGRGVTAVVEPGRRTLGERYELEQLIAAGGMGQVWRGTDVLLGRPVAVKVLRSEYTGDPTFRARFRAEAQHAAALNHPHIAAVFDYGEVAATDGTGETLAYLVMELVEGEPLSGVLHREGRLDTATTLSVLEQTAAALAEAHRTGLVHRDVKPGNILVRADGSVKITDFGIAFSAGSVPLTRTGQVIGTPQYLAPEVAEGAHATPAADVYALGLVGYECLTGRPAFDGENPITIALKQLREDPEPLPDDLPVDVRSLIRRALSKDPAARMADGAAFLAAIDDARAGRAQPDPVTQEVVVPVAALAPPPGPGGRRAARRSAPAPAHGRKAAVLVPLLALLVGAGVAAGLFAALPDDEQRPTVAAAQTRERAEVVLDADDYLGRPVDEVAAQLSALGLTVEREELVTPDSEPGVVTAVSPVDVTLQALDTVVVTFAVAPAPPPRPAPGRSSAGGSGDVAEDNSAPEQTSEPDPSVPSSPAAPAPDPQQGSPEPAPTTGAPPPTTTTPPSSGPPTSSTPSPPPSSLSPPPPTEEDPDGGEGQGEQRGDEEQVAPADGD
jgi:eukaryotic-like serine/threonine-protein kinase